MIQVFKFRAIDKYLIDSLVMGQIYFSPPRQLNDPFDCRVDAAESLRRAIDGAAPQERPALERLYERLEDFLGKFRADVEDFGVYAFSRTLLNTVMWAHYADSHRGLCLYYEIPESFLDWKKNGVIGTAPVQYDKNPIVQWLREQAPRVSDTTEEKLKIDLMQRLLTVKSKDWAFEEEARFVAHDHGPKSIDRDWLKQVCFGMATSERDTSLIRKIVEAGYTDVRFSRVESDGTDFGIVANDT